MTEDPAYKVRRLLSPKSCWSTLRSVFPDGEADEMNLALFSTSGTHGSYTTSDNQDWDAYRSSTTVKLTVLISNVAEG